MAVKDAISWAGTHLASRSYLHTPIAVMPGCGTRIRRTAGLLLDGYEALLMAVAVGVVPADRAVARRSARHRVGPGDPPGQAQVGRLAPDSVLLDGDEPRVVGLPVGPGGRAVARRGA